MSRLLQKPIITAGLILAFTAIGWTTAIAQSQPPGSESGYQSLFDGQTLTRWHGDERFWRVEDGAIVGETSDDNPAPHNTFLIYDGGSFGDFELQFSYRVKGFNSGIQYRSQEKQDFVVHGYQADFEDRWHDGGKDKFSGMFFEEGGRMFLAQRGQAVIVRDGPDEKPVLQTIASTGSGEDLETAIHRDDQWNHYTVIADGFCFTHIINDRVMAIGYDENVAKRAAEGIIALQLHEGPPMKIEVKDLKIRLIH